ncbi:MAG: MTH1187 family thiamine-binding protein [Pirellulales bacterium]
MLVEFSIYPLGGTRHLSKDIAHVIQTLGESGLHFELGPLSTAIEGDWDQVLAAIHKCHRKMVEAHDRVITTITIDECKSGQHRLSEMVESVKRQLPAQSLGAQSDF